MSDGVMGDDNNAMLKERAGYSCTSTSPYLGLASTRPFRSRWLVFRLKCQQNGGTRLEIQAR